MESVLSIENINTQSFREAWARFATGVTVITTAEADGSVHGMTANGVVSVSLEPPLALASIGHKRNSHPLIKKTGRFGISILNSDQIEVADHYTKPPEQRLPVTDFPLRRIGESTVVGGAIAMMDCRVISEHDEGDHTLFIAEVENVDFSDGEPLLWYRGSFGAFIAPTG